MAHDDSGDKRDARVEGLDFRALVEATPDSVVLIDEADVIRYVNAALTRKFGYAREDLVGQPLARLQPERLRERHREGLRRYRATGRQGVSWQAFETVAVTRDGTEFPVEISMSELPQPDGVYVAGFIRDVTRRHTSEQKLLETEQRLRSASLHDALTGLANRRLFIERAAQYMEQCRQRQAQLAVVVIDLVRFKAVNDALGRAVGDEVLKLAGERLKRFAGNPAYVARLGGDRFGAIVPDLGDAAELSRLLQERVWERLVRPVVAAGHEVPLPAQLGIAMFPSDGLDPATLIRHAEVAVKRAKDRSEHWLFYAPEMTASVTERLTLETQLRRALEQRQFTLHYQPKVDLRTGAICGAEALLRWRSPDRGLVLPEVFVPVLEETGLILDVGRWALQQAAADRRDWLAAQAPAVPVAVNVAAQQLAQADFVGAVCRAMETADGPGTGLEIEVTESMLIPGVEVSIEKLKRLRECSVPTAIDDFGTGYSSLAYLARLPVAAVKVDRSFVAGMAGEPDTTAIVSAIIALAHSMNLKVIAEGVETADQVRFLRLLRCDEMQGFLFSKALPPAEFADLLRSGRRLD